jgi:ABC-2 type transport system ATP-binding protein
VAEAAIVVEGLTKRFGDVVAVDRLSFEVPRGAVYGFLGPNGSGKTTTLGMVTGLVPPDAGSSRIAGSWGALVEEPAFYPSLTGRANLHLVRRLVGAPPAAVEGALARVGLDGRAAALRYRGYSQGMRRRLGLAAALVPDPAVLLLDEPTNGLDPGGQREVRDLLRAMAAEGRTVLVSSHLLHEVQETCTHAAILRRGRLVAAGTMRELLAARGERLVVEVDDVPRALAALQGVGGVAGAREEGGRLVLDGAAELAAVVNRRLVEAGVAVSGLAREEGVLEERFFEITEEPSHA